MKTFIVMNSLRYELMIKKRSKDILKHVLIIRRKMGESNRLRFFLSGVYSLFKRCYKTW